MNKLTEESRCKANIRIDEDRFTNLPQDDRCQKVADADGFCPRHRLLEQVGMIDCAAADGTRTTVPLDECAQRIGRLSDQCRDSLNIQHLVRDVRLWHRHLWCWSSRDMVGSILGDALRRVPGVARDSLPRQRGGEVNKLTEESIKQQVNEAARIAEALADKGYAVDSRRIYALCDTVETLLRALKDEVRKSDPFHRSKLSAAAEETVNDIVNDKLESAQRIEEAK